MAIVFSKPLKKTDITKRFSVRSKNKKCFLKFGEQQHRAEFKAVDEKGKVWPFVCTIRKEGYPKPVLSKGWLQFVHSWGLAEGDQVIFHDKDGRGYYRIQVVKLKQYSVRSHESYSNIQNQDESASAIESLADPHHTAEEQPISQWVGSEFGPNPPHVQVTVREPKLIDFFALELQQAQRRDPPFYHFL